MEKSRVSRQPGWIVYLCGFATSVLALYLVHLAANHDEHIMGWYGYGIIPFGALLVGVASGLGYAFGSYWMNVKLWKGFILGMMATAVVDYVAAQYITYLDVLEQVHASSENYSFAQYIRDMCENMSFSRSGSKESGSPLGVLGYVFKVLEMAGYTAGAVVPSLVLMGLPYCKTCQFYLRKNKTHFIPASMTKSAWKDLAKNQKTPVLEQQLQAIVQQAIQVSEQVTHTPYDITMEVWSALPAAEPKEAVGWVQLLVKKCPQCEAHHLNVLLVNNTVSRDKGQTLLADVDKTAAVQTNHC